MVKLSDKSRKDEHIWQLTLPIGGRVILTKQTYSHITKERGRDIKHSQIAMCVSEPMEIYRDCRVGRDSKRRIYACKTVVTPHGPKKSKSKLKHFVVHLKLVRKFYLFKVYYVSTAVVATRLPPGSEKIWQKGETVVV